MCSFDPSKRKEPMEYLGKEDDKSYHMGYKKKGLCYIFNHENFDGPKLSSLKKRIGTDIDAQRLNNVFKQKISFDVHEFKDYKYNQIMEKLQNVKKLDRSEYSSFVCCILTYGKKDLCDQHHLCDSEAVYPAKPIYQQIERECKAFAGKPKIVIIQACPGDIDVSSTESTDSGGGEQSERIFRIPTKSDFLYVFSTIPGKLSWNSSNKQGSWFIDELCSSIENHIEEMGLLQLLSIMNHKLCERQKKDAPEGWAVEVPCITSTLIREVDFFSQSPRNAEILRTTELLYKIGINDDAKPAKVLIFNHLTYGGKNIGNPDRRGAKEDRNYLKSIFKKPIFDTKYYVNKTKKSIFKKLHKAAESHERYSCFICCVSTHGNLGELSAYDDNYKLEEMLSCFYNKWDGKPKIFLLQEGAGERSRLGTRLACGRSQVRARALPKFLPTCKTACQGDVLDPGVKMAEKSSLTENSDCDSDSEESDSGVIASEVPINFLIHRNPDFLVLSAAPPGYRSIRNEKYGSWFFEELYHVFTSHNFKKDFLQLFTEINRRVAKRVSQSSVIEKNDKKQILCMTSTLTKNLNFEFQFEGSNPN